MWFTRTADTFRVWFRVEDGGGELRTGIDSGSFTITIRDPGDASSIAPTVMESGTPGLYRFDIPSSFFAANGVGTYGVLIVVSVVAPPRLNATAATGLRVSAQDWDSLVAAGSKIDDLHKLRGLDPANELFIDKDNDRLRVPSDGSVIDIQGVPTGNNATYTRQ